jgi:hypothetical protein
LMPKIGRIGWKVSWLDNTAKLKRNKKPSQIGRPISRFVYF